MKTIGLIGGMSWESSGVYYSLMNREVRALLGRSHSARCVLYSFDFQDVEELQYAGEWARLRAMMLDAGRALRAAGADFIVLCTNTMHKVVEGFEAEVGLPLLHIADATAEAVKAAGISHVGLLGTRFTMEGGFYAERLRSCCGLDVVIPEPGDRDAVNRVIYDELVHGVIRDESRARFEAVIDDLAARGAQAVILGCTEISLLIREHRLVPLFDTTALHARKAARMSLD